LVVEEVFKDARKGERQSPSAIQKAFGTTDIYHVLKEVLEKGEVQLTTEQKRKMMEEKKKAIVAYISQNAIDVRTNAPVPPLRIENAMEKLKIRVDPNKPVDAQIPEIVKMLKREIPLKIATAQIAIKVLPEHVGKVLGYLKSFKVKKEEWGSGGELYAIIEIPAGMQSEVFGKLNKLTSGTVDVKILEVKE